MEWRTTEIVMVKYKLGRKSKRSLPFLRNPFFTCLGDKSTVIPFEIVVTALMLIDVIEACHPCYLWGPKFRAKGRWTLNPSSVLIPYTSY